MSAVTVAVVCEGEDEVQNAEQESAGVQYEISPLDSIFCTG